MKTTDSEGKEIILKVEDYQLNGEAIFANLKDYQKNTITKVFATTDSKIIETALILSGDFDYKNINAIDKVISFIEILKTELHRKGTILN